MAAEAIRTELKVSGDKRLRAGLRGAIEHLAGRHGMSAAEQREFANEVDAECCKIAAQHESGACCDVVIEEQEDQIEVKVRRYSESSTARTASRHSAPPKEPQRYLQPKHSYPAASVRGTKSNGCVATTLVRHFQRKPAHL